MNKRKPRTCPGFCASACVGLFGSCPDIPTEYDEAEYSNGIKCSECGYNTGKCSDCIFENTPQCVEVNENEKI